MSKLIQNTTLIKYIKYFFFSFFCRIYFFARKISLLKFRSHSANNYRANDSQGRPLIGAKALRVGASRRESIHGAGGVSTAVYMQRQCCFHPYRENVTIAFHGPLLLGSSSGVPALLATRERDIGIARDKSDARNLAISHSERGVATDHCVPRRNHLLLRYENRSSTEGHGAQKDANSTRCWSWTAPHLISTKKRFVIRGKFIIASIFVTRGSTYFRVRRWMICLAKDLTRDCAVNARLR